MPSFPVCPLMSAPLLSLALVLVPVLALPTAQAADMPTTPVENARIDDFAVGKKAIEAKNCALAASSFSKVVAQNPQNADAYNLLGYSNRLRPTTRHWRWTPATRERWNTRAWATSRLARRRRPKPSSPSCRPSARSARRPPIWPRPLRPTSRRIKSG